MTLEQLIEQYRVNMENRDKSDMDSPEWHYFNDCGNALLPLIAQYPGGIAQLNRTVNGH